jgi:hypothetical protein
LHPSGIQSCLQQISLNWPAVGPAIIISVQITLPANLQSWWLTSSCKDGAVAKYCHMELSVSLLPYQFLCLPRPLSVFHTHKVPITSEAHEIFMCLTNLLHKMWWDHFNRLHHGFPSFHSSTLDSKSELGNLGVGKQPLPLIFPICLFSWVTPAQLESFE